MTKRVVATLLGPTASGKTALAIELAQRMDVALVSVDSAMVYRGLDIGTAKPEPETLAQHPHALVDIREPESEFSVREFCEEADKAIELAWQEEKVPLLVGGSMMYFRAFRDGLADLPSGDAQIRQEISQKSKEQGVQSIFEELQRLDPKTASRLDPLNLRRIERALEVFKLTGKPLVDLWQERSVEGAAKRLDCRLVEFIVPETPRPQLHARIEKRLRLMFERGLIEEVRKLRARPQLTQDCLSMRTVGYRETWSYLEKEISSEEELFNKVLYATRQLARKQLTWLRQWRNLNIHPAGDSDSMIEALMR